MRTFAGALLVMLPVVAVHSETPRLRIGIAVDAAAVTVSASSGALLASPWADAAPDGGLRPSPDPLRLGVRPAKPAPAPLPSRWWVRVRSVRTDREARLVVAGLKGAVSVPLAVRLEDGRRVVWAGPLQDEKSATRLAKRLAAAGMREARAEREDAEPVAAPPPSRLVALCPDWSVVAIPGERLLLACAGRSDGAAIEVDGIRYRGDVEVSVSGEGTLVAVNVVSIEDYLRGVVPKEMGPEVYPEIEALEAQAIAARSYVLAQLGRHGQQGFDACATAHCQVYGGASAEHPLSDRAVAATEDLVLAWNGKVANTLFSSTCGGMTEAVENVFDEEPVPYLAGVSCYPEQQAFVPVAGVAAHADWTLSDGRSADASVARLAVLGVLDATEQRMAGFGKRLKADEASKWVVRARAAAAVEQGSSEAADVDVTTASALVRSLVAALGWGERARLLQPPDLDAASRFAGCEGVVAGDLPACLIALQGGMLPDGLRPGWGGQRPTRALLLELLDGWLHGLGVGESQPARFRSFEEGVLRVSRGSTTLDVPLAPQPFLFTARKDGVAMARTSLELKVADKVSWLAAGDASAGLLAVEEDPDGAAFERTSAHTWWSAKRSLADVAGSAARRAGVEGLVDLKPTRRSPTGRIIGLSLVGSDGVAKEITGFEARQVLGLPELRADVRFERDAAGRLVALSAVGRGWGHGVGLCQTGGFGMAMAGASHAAILQHYYPGTTLVRAGELAAPPATPSAH